MPTLAGTATPAGSAGWPGFGDTAEVTLTAPARVDSGRPAIDRVLPVVTPEGAALELELAGLGARAAAAALDLVIAALALFVISAAGVDLRAAPRPELTVLGVDWADSAFRAGLRFLVPAVVAIVAVPLVQELTFGGRSLGKRAFRMRVVKTDGTRPSPAAIVIRNLLRPLDLLPGTYAIGAISLLVSRRAQRLGDIAAGTAVVRLRRALLVYGQVNLPPTPWQSMGPPTVDGQAIATARVDTQSWDLDGLTPEHREVLQAFAARRYGLPPAVRESFTGWLGGVLRRAIEGVPEDLPDAMLIDVLLLRLTVARKGPRGGG